MLVVVSIIVLLTGIGVSSYTTVSRRSRDARRLNDLEQIRSALEMYRAANGYYPNVGSGSWTNVSNLRNLLVPTYMQKIPSDPRHTTD
ncbi:MAG: hypothetical protein N3A54_01400, partial [Patescibacteria group bacterium]|nr:hypothetical protein [Patescibacteria group bacterium]